MRAVESRPEPVRLPACTSWLALAGHFSTHLARLGALCACTPVHRFPACTLATLLAAMGASSGLVIAALLSRDPREAIAYTLACVMIGGAVALGRRGVVDPAEAARLEMRAMAHDLRGPLLTVSSYLDLIADGSFGAVTGEGKVALRHAAGVVRRAQEIVEHTLKQPCERSDPALMPRVELEEVMHEVLDALTLAMRQHAASVSIEGRLPAVRGDRTALFRVFENLVQNSIAYARPDRAPRIHLGVRRGEGRERGTVEVIVRDNGRGIRPEEAESVFLAGVRGSASAGTRGHGLGLSTVARLVTMMGGAVSVDAPPTLSPEAFEYRPGGGATVRVRLHEA